MRIVSSNGVTQDYTDHADGSRLTVTTSGLGTTLSLNGACVPAVVIGMSP